MLVLDFIIKINNCILEHHDIGKALFLFLYKLKKEN